MRCATGQSAVGWGRQARVSRGAWVCVLSWTPFGRSGGGRELNPRWGGQMATHPYPPPQEDHRAGGGVDTPPQEDRRAAGGVDPPTREVRRAIGGKGPSMAKIFAASRVNTKH
jgi:hypothetical protein